MTRRTDYKPEYCEEARKLCALGATDVQLADFFEVTLKAINGWRGRYKEFYEACMIGKEVADQAVERALYQRATGYSFDAVKIFWPKDAEEAAIVPYVEHTPPDVTACIFWLKNRNKDKWRDKIDHTLTGKDGDPIQIITGVLRETEIAMIERRNEKLIEGRLAEAPEVLEIADDSA